MALVQNVLGRADEFAGNINKVGSSQGVATASKIAKTAVPLMDHALDKKLRLPTLSTRRAGL